MRNIFALLLMILLGLALIACSGEKQAEETQQAEPQMEAATAQVDSLADMAVCPSCGMEHNKADMISYETEEGDTLYFCSENCQKMYMAKAEEETTE
jgi:YHS domain-containing protein